jgi:hypothetical protein
MSYIGNTNTTQGFTPAIDYFSGNASTTAFTLSRPVASVAQVQAVVNNVAQNPSDAFTVSGNTITFTSAPSSGTNNIYVYYTSPITQVIAPSQGTVGTTQLQNGLTVNFADGTAAAPSITNDGDTNTGIFFPAADTIAFAEGGVEAMRINSSGNVGIGTSSVATTLDVRGANKTVSDQYGVTNIYSTDTFAINKGGSLSFGGKYATDGSVQTFGAIAGRKEDAGDGGWAGYIQFATGAPTLTEQMRLTSTGDLRFNSGYGSVATAYGCRAWVNFNGTGTVAIRASGNVSSITDNGTGDYTVNFTTAMPDANYSLVGTVQFDTSGNEASHNLMGLEIKGIATPLTTTSARVAGKYGGATALYDMNTVAVAIFR